MTGLTPDTILKKTQSEIKTLVEIGEEVYKQNNYQQNLLLDLLDYQLASIAYLINNAYYKPSKLKDFLFLKHDNIKPTKKLTEVEAAIDAEIQVKADILAKQIKDKKLTTFFNQTN